MQRYFTGLTLNLQCIIIILWHVPLVAPAVQLDVGSVSALIADIDIRSDPRFGFLIEEIKREALTHRPLQAFTAVAPATPRSRERPPIQQHQERGEEEERRAPGAPSDDACASFSEAPSQS